MALLPKRIAAMVVTALAVLILSSIAVLASPASANGGLTVPTRGYVTQLFLKPIDYEPEGYYYNQNNQRQFTPIKFHRGLDIGSGGKPGVYPVYASAAGVVKLLPYDGTHHGTQLAIAHGSDVGGNGLFTYTLYSHMGRWVKDRHMSYVVVSDDQHVDAGQLIGYQGNDGHSNGVHLHWEIGVSSAEVTSTADLRSLVEPASPDFYTGLHLTYGDPRPILNLGKERKNASSIKQSGAHKKKRKPLRRGKRAKKHK